MSLLTREVKEELKAGFYETLIHGYKEYADEKEDYIIVTFQLTDVDGQQYVFMNDKITDKRVGYILKNLNDQFGIDFKTLGECLDFGTIPSETHKNGKNHSFILGLSYSEKYGKQFGYKAVGTDILKSTEKTETLPKPIPFKKKK